MSHAPSDGADRLRDGASVSFVIATSQRTGKTQAEEILFEDAEIPADLPGQVDGPRPESARGPGELS